MKIKSIVAVILALGSLIFFTACYSFDKELEDDDDDVGDDDDDAGDDDDNDTGDDDEGDDDTDDDNDLTNDFAIIGEIWTDSTSGLMWQKDPTRFCDWYDAKIYCDGLSWNGYSDWRLPSISELRTLIRECDATKTGGSCGVTDSCLQSDCWDDSCTGCLSNNGPGPNGLYWPSELDGECCGYWSSSEVTDFVNYAWYIHFNNGLVEDYGVREYKWNVRCVR